MSKYSLGEIIFLIFIFLTIDIISLILNIFTAFVAGTFLQKIIGSNLLLLISFFKKDTQSLKFTNLLKKYFIPFPVLTGFFLFEVIRHNKNVQKQETEKNEQ